MNTDFRPPRTNRVVVGAAYTLLPLASRLGRRLESVEFDKAEWQRLTALRERRFILTPNHPSANDPLIAVWIARRLARSFYYLACRELFDSPYGTLLQRFGCYSILRGAADRESLRMTRTLLAEQDAQVVIFPEGRSTATTTSSSRSRPAWFKSASGPSKRSKSPQRIARCRSFRRW